MSDTRLTNEMRQADAFNVNGLDTITHQARTHQPLTGWEAENGAVGSAPMVWSPSASRPDEISVVPEQRESSLRCCSGLLALPDSR